MKTLTMIMKFISATVLLCVTGFCVFVFLESFEVGWFSRWHCLYGICGIGSLTMAMSLLLCRTLARTLAGLALLALALFCAFRFMESYFTYLFPWQVVGGGALGGCLLTGGVALLRRKGDGGKPPGALALFAVATFCVLGFMESYLKSPWPWQAGYGVFVCGCLTGGVAWLRRRADSSHHFNAG
jgi:hypothetical protein